MISGFIDVLARIIESISILSVIPEYETGIRWTFGHPGKSITGGCLWKIPLVQGVESVDITAGSFTLEPQCLTTRDGKNIMLAAGVIYRVEDPLRYCMTVGNNDADEVIGALCRGVIAQRIMAEDLKHLVGNVKVVEEDLIAEVQDTIEQYGLTVDNVVIAEFCEVFALKTFS